MAQQIAVQDLDVAQLSDIRKQLDDVGNDYLLAHILIYRRN